MAKNSASGHHHTTLSGCIFAIRHVSTIGKKLVKQQYLPHMSLQYGELRPTNGWDRFTSLGHPSTFQRVSRIGSVTARHYSSGRQPNFVALNRGRHLYLAGRPSRWALAQIIVHSWNIKNVTSSSTYNAYNCRCVPDGQCPTVRRWKLSPPRINFFQSCYSNLKPMTSRNVAIHRDLSV